jgi:hypothetical protein
MAFFNSLVDSGLHNHCAVETNLFKWLNNSLWNHTFTSDGNLFSGLTMPVVFRDIPDQINGYDCGAYVYHYAFHLFSIKDIIITKSDIKSNNPLHGSFSLSLRMSTPILSILLTSVMSF